MIVAVVDKEKERLLLTRYAGRRGGNYALIAGFSEVGETLEETARREVMEEVGLKIRNLHYYASQPWSFSDTLLAGFYAELDGSDEIQLEREELSEGVWLSRDEIPGSGHFDQPYRHDDRKVPERRRVTGSITA